MPSRWIPSASNVFAAGSSLRYAARFVGVVGAARIAVPLPDRLLRNRREPASDDSIGGMNGAGRSGRVVLVTGASSGIGLATARRCAAAGYHVFGTSRQQRADHDGVRMLQMDLSSAESAQACVDAIQRRAGRIDVLINNAGVMHRGMAEETTADEAAAVFGVNFFGTARLIKAVLPGMRHRREGWVVNVGSAAAWVGEPGEAFYAASKAALARYTEALRQEVWHRGIRVSLVEPGAFATAMVDRATGSVPGIADYDPVREAARATFEVAAHNGQAPERVAELIVRIIGSEWPRARYGAGREARWIPLARVLLPQRALDALLRRSFHLPNRNT